MSREIKFRAWGVFHKRMHEIKKDGLIEELDSSNKWRVMQFTGLIDKTGVEIYEGDVLSNKMCNPRIGYVIFRKGAYQLRAIKNFNCIYVPLSHENMTVIGNIHQHPELLTVTANEPT